MDSCCKTSGSDETYGVLTVCMVVACITSLLAFSAIYFCSLVFFLFSADLDIQTALLSSLLFFQGARPLSQPSSGLLVVLLVLQVNDAILKIRRKRFSCC